MERHSRLVHSNGWFFEWSDSLHFKVLIYGAVMLGQRASVQVAGEGLNF